MKNINKHNTIKTILTGITFKNFEKDFILEFTDFYVAILMTMCCTISQPLILFWTINVVLEKRLKSKLNLHQIFLPTVKTEESRKMDKLNILKIEYCKQTQSLIQDRTVTTLLYLNHEEKVFQTLLGLKKWQTLGEDTVGDPPVSSPLTVLVQANTGLELLPYFW